MIASIAGNHFLLGITLTFTRGSAGQHQDYVDTQSWCCSRLHSTIFKTHWVKFESFHLIIADQQIGTQISHLWFSTILYA